MNKLNLLIGILLILAGCASKDIPGYTIKIEYGPWKQATATVVEHSIITNKETNLTVIKFDNKKIYLPECKDCKIGDTIQIQYREVYTIECTDKNCTIIDEKYEAQLLYIYPD